MSHIIGATRKDIFGRTRLVYGEHTIKMNVGNYIRYQIRGSGFGNLFRIEGIRASSIKNLHKLLKVLEKKVKEAGYTRIDYIDDIPTEEEITAFIQEGYKRITFKDKFNIHLRKDLDHRQ